MSLIVYSPVALVALYLLTELLRKSPKEEQRYNHLSSILIAASNFLMFLLPTWMHLLGKGPSQPLYFLLGIVIGLAGVGVRVTAMITLGRYFSRFISIQESHQIIRKGLYRSLRHPGYLGTLLIFVGFALALASWLGVLINIGIFFTVYSYRMSVEERMMVNYFGPSYHQYQKETYKILPYLY